MADTAAFLVDHVIPDVPVRQWVLTLPHRIRYMIAYDPALCSAVLDVFIRAVFGWQRRVAKRAGIELAPEADCGAVTVIQRFGSSLGLNPHFHSIFLDGVFAIRPGERRPTFHPLPPPTDEEVARIAETIRKRVTRMLKRRGRLPTDDHNEPEPSTLELDNPALAECSAASVLGRIAFGPRAGQRVERDGAIPGLPWVETSSPRCATADGFNLHANTAVEVGQRGRLEHLCRYVSRPAICDDRLMAIADGRIMYRLRRPFRDGTVAIMFQPVEFVEKLAALVPRPRVHLTRYHGILAPNAKLRPAVVPGGEAFIDAADEPEAASVSVPAADKAPAAVEADDTTAAQASPGAPDAASNPPSDASGAKPKPAGRKAGKPGTRRYVEWAELMKRVHGFDVLRCRKCGATMRVIASIRDPAITKKILECLGLPAQAPEPHPARPPPQPELDFAIG